MPARSHINVQDHFLNQARREKIEVSILLMNGKEVEGHIKSFDNYCCVVEGKGSINLIYKHAITSVSPLVPEKMRTLISFTEK